jgi:DNA invertase Pin-like site-specific DNA recombinase
MRYVVYLRVSTDLQADTGLGLDIQEEACRAWLRAGKHRLVEVCTDAGRSGAADVVARPGLTRALALLAADKADGLIVYRLDRLARDLILQEQVLAELHRRGKELSSCSPTEDANLHYSPDDPTRALVRRILGSIAAYERDVVRLRLKAGRVRKEMLGGYAGGRLPYGWAAVRGEAVQVPDEQRALRLMCRLVGEGWSYRRVCAELERREIPSKAAHGRWRPNTVREIVLREAARKGRRNALPSPTLEMESA